MIQITLLTEHVCLKIKGERVRKRGGFSHGGGSQEALERIKRDQNKSNSRASHVIKTAPCPCGLHRYTAKVKRRAEVGAEAPEKYHSEILCIVMVLEAG